MERCSDVGRHTVWRTYCIYASSVTFFESFVKLVVLCGSCELCDIDTQLNLQVVRAA